MPLIFAQVEATAAVPPDAAATEQAKPLSTSAEEKPAAEKPTAEKPAEKAPAKETIIGEEKTAPQIADPFAGGAEAQLHFSEKLDRQSVEDLLKVAL